MGKALLSLFVLLVACSNNIDKKSDIYQKYNCNKMCGYVFSEPPYIGCKDYDIGYVEYVPGQDTFHYVGNFGEILFYKKSSKHVNIYYESRPDSPDVDPFGLEVKDGIVAITTAGSSYECIKE